MFQKVMTKVFGSKEDRDVKNFETSLKRSTNANRILKNSQMHNCNPKHQNFAKNWTQAHRLMNSYQMHSLSSEKPQCGH